MRQRRTRRSQAGRGVRAALGVPWLRRPRLALPRLALPRLALPPLAVVSLAAVLLAGCSSAVTVTPGPAAADPVCSRVITALPARVAGSDRRSTTAQASTAWGDPPIVLRCGVTPPGPSTRCQDVETPSGVRVDWIVGRPHAGRVTWTTFGRVPAVALTMPARGSVTGAAPLDVAEAVALTDHRVSCS